jgi:hypothetical protein
MRTELYLTEDSTEKIKQEPNQAWTTLFPSVSASGNMHAWILLPCFATWSQSIMNHGTATAAAERTALNPESNARILHAPTISFQISSSFWEEKCQVNSANELTDGTLTHDVLAGSIRAVTAATAPLPWNWPARSSKLGSDEPMIFKIVFSWSTQARALGWLIGIYKP